MVDIIYDRAERSSKKEHGYDPYRFMSDSNLRKGIVEKKPIFITLDNFPYNEQLLDVSTAKDLENTFDSNEFNHQEFLRTLRRLARQETRLAKLDSCVQEALIQWGYFSAHYAIKEKLLQLDEIMNRSCLSDLPDGQAQTNHEKLFSSEDSEEDSTLEYTKLKSECSKWKPFYLSDVELKPPYPGWTFGKGCEMSMTEIYGTP